MCFSYHNNCTHLPKPLLRVLEGKLHMLLIKSRYALSWLVSFKAQLSELRVFLSLGNKAVFLPWINGTEAGNTEADMLNQTNGQTWCCCDAEEFRIGYEIPVMKGTSLPNPRQSLLGFVLWSMKNDITSMFFNAWQGTCDSYCLDDISFSFLNPNVLCLNCIPWQLL